MIITKLNKIQEAIQSPQLQQFAQHNEFYKYSDLPKIAKIFDVEIFVKPTENLPVKYMAVFPRSYNPSFQVFIHTETETIEISASHW